MPRKSYDVIEDLMVACPRCAGSGFEYGPGDNPETGKRVYVFDPETGDYRNCVACNGEGRILSKRTRRKRT